MRTIMAGLAEFERDLIRDRVKSGLAAARARGVKLGRQYGQRPSDRKAKRELAMHKEGLSYRLDGPQRRAQQEHSHGDRQARRDATILAMVSQTRSAHGVERSRLHSDDC